ncbi:L-aspartate oxidase [Novisyntrophococcus fermenticellae]|uniref:L-aspartate oxidase n=1 Tax=Novisyntrophococcus fermenticellae TaxID=2068655 RepID=UPI001E29825D|nr:L-aspartate oxidase [Novisyntrophococcus fermenticellae]
MEYDIIIVGTGVGGCFAALNLPDNQKILMITKADLEESDSFLAQGGICMLKSEEDYEAYYEDTMRAGHYENTPESVDVMIRSSQEIIQDLIGYGVEFEQEDGKLKFTREGAHSTNRILYHEDETGKEITKKLLNTVLKLDNVTIKTHTVMRDILTRENHCEGILMETEEGNLEAVTCKDVIWACGGIGGIYENSTNFPHLTGDALAIALKHQIALKNIDYVQIHPTTLYSKKTGRRFLISESVRGEGATLYNRNMERFVDELLPRDVVSNAIFDQMKKDESKYVWLSFKTIQNMDIRKRFPNIYQHCLEEGYDITKECIPVVPSQHYFMGGVQVDLNSQTTMKHLYAVGETSCNGVHGANRLASNSLLESLVFAKRAAKYILSQQDRPVMRLRDANDLERIYHIDLDAYKDMKKYEEKCKKSIWKAIGEEKRHECSHKEIKCG